MTAVDSYLPTTVRNPKWSSPFWIYFCIFEEKKFYWHLFNAGITVRWNTVRLSTVVDPVSRQCTTLSKMQCFVIYLSGCTLRKFSLILVHSIRPVYCSHLIRYFLITQRM